MANASAKVTAMAMPFVTHAAFFSKETHQTDAVDPQVFVADPQSQAGTGPQGIEHVAGIRPKGHYSLFENYFDQKPVGFTPLDGAGEHNNIVAGKNGSAKLTVTALS